MYDIDPKFFNRDGSLDTHAACAAGRKAQAQTAAEGARAFKALCKSHIDQAINIAWAPFKSRNA